MHLSQCKFSTTVLGSLNMLVGITWAVSADLQLYARFLPAIVKLSLYVEKSKSQSKFLLEMYFQGVPYVGKLDTALRPGCTIAIKGEVNKNAKRYVLLMVFFCYLTEVLLRMSRLFHCVCISLLTCTFASGMIWNYNAVSSGTSRIPL